MAAHLIPASGSTHIVKGADELVYFEERLATGEPKAVLDTPVWREIICGAISYNWPDISDADEDVKVKTPVTGREYTALAAVQAVSASGAGPTGLEIVITVLESSGLHLSLPDKLQGKVFALLHHLGLRGGFYTDFGGFVKYKGVAVSQKMEPGKETSYDLTFVLTNHTEDVVFSTLPVGGEIAAAAITIPAGDGYIYVDTAV